ncbi:hypothetical protein [Dyadobacter bucti]|uniref:hypothetical protein n=1 Tax=Dyadobacter bucti TaxID=2572203 RepID=UPI0011092F45|nr:hypothetical protein [Dyadobacter bucti]
MRDFSHLQINMQEKSQIKRNILQFLEYKGIGKSEFYRQTGITRSVLDQNNGMSEDNLARFLVKFPEVRAEWLILGEGEMLKAENNSENAATTIEKKSNQVEVLKTELLAANDSIKLMQRQIVTYLDIIDDLKKENKEQQDKFSQLQETASKLAEEIQKSQKLKMLKL